MKKHRVFNCVTCGKDSNEIRHIFSKNSKYLNFYVPGIIFELSKIWTLENFNFQMILNFKYSTFADVLKGLLEIFTVWTLKKKKLKYENFECFKIKFFKF